MKMNRHRLPWLTGLALALAVVAAVVAACLPGNPSPDQARPDHPIHTDHTDIVSGPFDSPQAVTAACLECHPDAATQVMATTHWTWEGEPVAVPWREEPVTIGKKNQLNNFCIGIQGNQRTCTSCHAGYGWADDSFDFAEPANVDCLACHADVALYAKGNFGIPAEDVDLLAAARSVAAPTRENCGACHFDGGGGNGVKHGDLDGSLLFPSESLDVHMGREDFLCTDCHRTEDHAIQGRLLADNYTIDPAEQVACADCHTGAIHDDERIALHDGAVACQTCHVPAMALKNPTKTFWDWSEAGQDRPDDHYSYLKIKGSFVYDKDVTPTYAWFNGSNEYRYIMGDPMDPSQPTLINVPAGSIDDPAAKISPFKVHVAQQPYDSVYNILIPPRTSGEGGFWSEFDWDAALALGAADNGLPFSGEYDFAETWMYWPTTHMVQSADKALQCDDCHAENGRLDWQALGYPGDPMEWGSRSVLPDAVSGR